MKFLKKSELFNPLVDLFSGYILKYLKYVVMSVLCMIVVAIMTGLSGYMLKPVINKVFIEKSHQKLVQICIIYFTISVIKALASYFQNIMIFYVQDKIVGDLRRDLFKRMIHLNINSIYKIKEKFIGVFANDVKIISENFTPLVQTMVRDFWSVFALLIVVFYQNFKLASVAFIVFPLALLFLKKMTKNVRYNYKESQLKNDILINSINYVISGIKTIKSYTAENYEIRKFEKVLFYFFKYSFKFKKKSARGSPFMEVVGGLSTVMVIFYGGLSVINGTSDAGGFFSFLVSLIMAYRPAKSLSGFGAKLQACSISTSRILDLLKEGEIETNLKEEIIEHKKSEKESSENYDITFENVNFSYLKENEKETLENISFKIKQGEKVAFVGTSGSGKSTIVDLLMKFSNSDSGSIKIGQTDINTLSVQDVRRKISYVTQDTFLFNQDINLNIAYNSKKKSFSVEDAANFACIDFNQENNKDVDKNANNLSFGQRQRIGIARAIFKDAPISVFDESTSALDTITEKKIMDNIFKFQNKTIIIIAHRIHLLPACDRIYVVDKGRIVEEGDHSTLMSAKNIYFKLWNALMENSNL